MQSYFLTSEDKTTGYLHEVHVFDSERKWSDKIPKIYGINFRMFEEEYVNKGMYNWMEIFLKKYWYTMVQPHPGTNGILETYSPSKEHPVTSMDITFRMNTLVKHEDFFHLPSIKFNTKATMTTKREEKTLKTWDMSAILDMNSGHTVAHLKMQLARHIPDQKSYAICMDYTKKWTKTGVAGIFLMDDTSEGDATCTVDKAMLEITMKGEKSEEQLMDYPMYGECDMYISRWHGVHHKLMPCYVAHDTFRNYTYHIATKDMSQEMKRSFIVLWDYFKAMNYHNYIFDFTPSMPIDKDHMKIFLEYEMADDSISTTVVTPNHEYHFEKMHWPMMKWMMFEPDTEHVSKMYKFMRKMGWMRTCGVYNDTIYMRYDSMEYNLPSEWTMMMGDSMDKPMWAVFMKEMEGHHMMVCTI